jgi:hypothetical protein
MNYVGDEELSPGTEQCFSTVATVSSGATKSTCALIVVWVVAYVLV